VIFSFCEQICHTLPKNLGSVRGEWRRMVISEEASGCRQIQASKVALLKSASHIAEI